MKTKPPRPVIAFTLVSITKAKPTYQTLHSPAFMSILAALQSNPNKAIKVRIESKQESRKLVSWLSVMGRHHGHPLVCKTLNGHVYAYLKRYNFSR